MPICSLAATLCNALLEGKSTFHHLVVFAQDRAVRLSDIVRVFLARPGTAAEIAQVFEVYLINSQFKFNLY